MSSGLVTITGTSGQSTTLTVTRPGGHATTETISVSGLPLSGQLDPANMSTGVGILNTRTDATPLHWDYARYYDSDTGGTKPWRAQISSNLGGTGSGGSNNKWPANVRYGDGINAGDVLWVSTPDATFTPAFSEPCFEFTVRASNLAATTGQNGTLAGVLNNGVTTCPSNLWVIRRKAMCTSFTGVGDADDTNWGLFWNTGGTKTNVFQLSQAITANVSAQSVLVTPNVSKLTTAFQVVVNPGGANQETVNVTAVPDSTHFSAVFTQNHSAGETCNVTCAGQGAGWKTGPAATYLGTGDARLESTNWTNSGSSGGADGDYIFQNLPNAVGINECAVARTDAAYRNGNVELEGVYWEHWYDSSDSTYWTAESFWRKRATDTNWLQVGDRVVTQVTGLTALKQFYELTPTALNYNHSRKTNLKWWMTHHVFFDADASAANADPAGIKDYFSHLAPEAPTSLAASGVTSTAMTLTVVPGRFTGKLRAQIDGTWVTGQDYTMRRRDSAWKEPTNGGGLTKTNTVTVPLSGLSLATGTHTVKVFGVSGDGTVVETTGSSTTITV